MSLYDELGVASDADADEINAAYRQRAKRAHPDAGGDPEAFGRLSQAVAVLRDPERRAEYDRTGSTEPPPGDTIHGEAIQMLVEAFQQVLRKMAALPATRSAQVDFVMETRKALRQNETILTQARDQALQEQLTTARLIDRLSTRGDGPDVLRKVLDDKMAALSSALEQSTRMEMVLHTALKMSEDYSWRVDAPAPMPAGYPPTMSSVFLSGYSWP